MYEPIKCSSCGEIGFAVILGSDVKKLSANIICLYCWNNLPRTNRVEVDFTHVARKGHWASPMEEELEVMEQHEMEDK